MKTKIRLGGSNMTICGKQQNRKRILLMLALACAAAALFLVFGALKTEAKTFVIRTPEQLENINWKNAGYGPGHTYIIGNDMTLTEKENKTCLLTKGNFVIDLNGHTVQTASPNLAAFHVAGANVVLKDSKAKRGVPSINSLGLGAVQITAGKLTIQSGNYLGNGYPITDSVALHVGGGTCIVNGGEFAGSTYGATVVGGTLYINNNAIFEGGTSHALLRMGGGNIRISNATFATGKTTYGYSLALGAYVGPGSDGNADFGSWLASGSSFSPDFQVGFWNMQSSVTTQPSMSNIYAVTWNTPVLNVTGTVKAPVTSIKAIKAKKRALIVGWKKAAGASGYILQYSTAKNFKKAKTLIVKGGTKKAAVIKKLKAKKYYFVRVRTYRNFNGTTLYSAWSKAKAKKTK